MQEVIVHLITDRVSITIRRVDVICDESKSLFCQDGFARTGRDVIIRIDRILQVRCKNGIDIVAAIFDIVGTNLAIDINQSLRRTIDSYRGFTIIIAIGQASDSYSILESILDTLHVAINLLETICRDGQICFVDFKVTLCLDDFVVDACTILEADIFHVDSIFIRIWISVCCRTTDLMLSIAATGFDGKGIGALVELIIIGKCLARCTFLRAGERCSEFPVVDGCVAVGLAAAAVDVDLASENFDCAAILCGCTGVAARCAFSCQFIVVRSGFDVVNSIIIVCSCFIAARTRCGLGPASTRERALASVVITYRTFRKGSFILSFIDIVFFVILSNERCFSGGRDIVTRQFFAVVFAVDFRHVVGGDIDGRLYLEDVLVLIVSCQVRIARCAPLCICAAVEVRAERVAVWRCGVDFPVAAFASRDGFLCRSQVLEGTIRAACVDDNGIVIRRLSNQCTIIMGVVQYDCAALTRRGQVDVFMSRDTIDIDVARSLDIDAVIDGGNAVAYSDVCSMNRNTFIRTNLTSVRSASSRSSATNGHVTSRIDCEVFQAH